MMKIQKLKDALPLQHREGREDHSNPNASAQEIHVCPRFLAGPRNHMAQLSASTLLGTNAPLIFAVAGKSGDGKTTMLGESLKRMGTPVTKFSGSSASGQFEGDSVQNLTREYLRNGRREEMFPIPALFWEDFELSPAGINANQGATANQSLLNGTIMNIQDYPDQVAVNYLDENNMSQSQTFKGLKPSAIFFTANDLTKIHPPLMRRATVMQWIPTVTETCDVVSSILPGFERREVETLVAAHPDEPIAFFAAIPRRFAAQAIDRFFGDPASGANALADPRAMAKLAKAIAMEPSQLGLEGALACAAEIVAEKSHIANYLDT